MTGSWQVRGDYFERCGVCWRIGLQVELRAEDQGSAILATFLLNKGNGSSIEARYKPAFQGIIETVKSAECHDGSSSQKILQTMCISIRA